MATGLATRGFVQMDHILEKQCFLHAFYLIPNRGCGEGVDYLVEFVKEEVVSANTKTIDTSSVAQHTAHPESVVDAVITSLGAGGAPFSPRAIQVIDQMSQSNRDSKKATSSDATATSNIFAQCLSKDVKSVGSCDSAVALSTGAKLDNKLDSVESGGHRYTTVANTAHCKADPKPADSTSRDTNAKMKILDAFAEPFVPNAIDSPHQIDDASRESVRSSTRSH